MRYVVLAAVGIAALAPASAAAQEPPPAGVVTTVQGTVMVTRYSPLTRPSAPSPLAMGDKIFLGDRITTDDRSKARILLGRKAVVTVSTRSTLTIDEEAGRSIVTLDSGEIHYAVARDRMRPGEVHEIHTPNAIAQVRGTILAVRTEPGAGSQAAVTVVCAVAGTVFAGGLRGAELPVAAGRCVTITGDVLSPRPPRPPRPAPTPRDLDLG